MKRQILFIAIQMILLKIGFTQFNPPLNFIGSLYYSYPPVYYRMDFEWDIPDTIGITPDLIGYVIYQDNDSLDFIDLNSTEYHYVLPDSIWYDTLLWYMTAIYENPNGESSHSDSVIIDDYPIGINIDANENKIEIYPNPMLNYTFLKFNTQQGEIYKLKIYTSEGKVVKLLTGIDEGEILIKRKNLKTGIYFIELSDKINNIWTGKLMIK